MMSGSCGSLTLPEQWAIMQLLTLAGISEVRK
jgi:hypothetical protein